MKFNDFVVFYFDHDKFRKKIMAILKKDNLTPEDIARSIGYSDQALNDYLIKRKSDSKFIAGALCDRFHLNPKKFLKEF